MVIRTRDEEGSAKYDFYLSDAPPETWLRKLAWVATAEHRVEECIQRAKSDASMDNYHVRTWRSWYRHMALAMIAVWFLSLETTRAKGRRP